MISYRALEPNIRVQYRIKTERKEFITSGKNSSHPPLPFLYSSNAETQRLYVNHAQYSQIQTKTLLIHQGPLGTFDCDVRETERGGVPSPGYNGRYIHVGHLYLNNHLHFVQQKNVVRTRSQTQK